MCVSYNKMDIKQERNCVPANVFSPFYPYPNVADPGERRGNARRGASRDRRRHDARSPQLLRGGAQTIGRDHYRGNAAGSDVGEVSDLQVPGVPRRGHALPGDDAGPEGAALFGEYVRGRGAAEGGRRSQAESETQGTVELGADAEHAFLPGVFYLPIQICAAVPGDAAARLLSAAPGPRRFHGGRRRDSHDHLPGVSYHRVAHEGYPA